MMPRSDSKERLKSSDPDQHEENKKAIIDSSSQLAVFRGLIHIFPILICIILMTLNLKSVYIGPTLQFGSWTTTYSLAAFQVAAKVQGWLSRDHVYLRELTVCDRNFFR